MGDNEQPRIKAEEDYEKRTAAPGDVDPAQAAYDFVTPRRWQSKDAWLKTRRAEGLWREVHAYDADDLETWLELSPPVHTWLSILLGKAPEGVQDLGSAWEAWAGATVPPMSAGLVTAGRETIAEGLCERIQAAPGVTALKADSRDEALAFYAAALGRLPGDEGAALVARSLV